MVEVFLLLAQHGGRVVERRVIERAVWSEAAVGTDLLNRTIWKLRRVLEDDAGDPRYIETIPRVGYRLLTAVEGTAVSDAPPGPAPAHSHTPSRSDQQPVIGRLGPLVLLTILFALWHFAGPVSKANLEYLVSTPLTSHRGYEANPSVSPQGRYVAFQQYDPDAPEPSWNVALIDLGSQMEQPLASVPGVHEYAPTWAPHGDSVAYVRSGEDCEILVKPLNGEAVEAAPCQADQSHELAWLQGGDLVIASLAPGQTLGLERIRRDSGEREQLTVPPAGYDGDWMPRVSPDGSRLAFVRQRTDGVSDIYLLGLTRGARSAPPKRITFFERRIRGLTWDPSGRALLFTSPRGGTSQVWRIPAEGGTAEPVALPGRNAGPLSATEGILVYEEYRGDSDLWLYDPRTSRVEPWLESTRSEWGATASPDGSSVAFVSDRTGSEEIWIVPIEGGEPRRLTALDGAEVDAPQWHPDSRHLVFASSLYGSFNLFTVDVETDSVTRVTRSNVDERNPIWWNESIVYSANRSGTRDLWILNPGEGEGRRLTSGGGSVARPSASGVELLFTRPGEEGLWRLDDDPGGMVRVWGSMGDDVGTNWWPTSDGILRLRSTDGTQSELVLLDLSSGRESVLARLPQEISPRSGLTRLPDGRVILGVITRSESDLWLAR